MVKVDSGGVNFYLDGYLKSNLEYIRDDLRDDNDAVMIVDGFEGSGKSLMAMQIAKFIDPTFNLDRVVFTPDEFHKQVKTAKKYQAVVFDEAITGMRARRWAGDVNNAIIEMLAQIRQKNLAIIIVIPSYFELEKYVAIHRSIALIHVYRKEGKRGHFMVFVPPNKTYLYAMGKKIYSYSVTNPKFIGRFTNTYTVDEKLYRKKKLQALEAKPKEEPMGRLQIRYKIQRDELLLGMKREFKYTDMELGRFTEKYLSSPLKAEGVKGALGEARGGFKMPVVIKGD